MPSASPPKSRDCRATRSASTPRSRAAASGDGATDLPYAIPNVLVDQVVLGLPAVPRGPWRSVGVSHNGFVTECFLDEVAAAAGRDPFELRRELLRDKARHRRTLELAADKAGWGAPPQAGRGPGIAPAGGGPTV